jgi:ZIP family zinc transporter
MNGALILGLAATTCGATMMGGLFALNLVRHIGVMLGFSAGAVLGVALFDLLPEAVKLDQSHFGWRAIVLAAAGGFLIYGLFDRLVARHDKLDRDHEPTRGILGAGGFSLHSLLDGLGIGVAFQASHQAGIIVAAAVLAHDFADGLNTVNVVVKHGGSRAQALRWLWTDALAPVVGAAISLFVHFPGEVLALLLAGFVGFFIYIGALDLLPESWREGPRWASCGATVLGAAFLFAVARLSA